MSITVEELVACGLVRADAEKLYSQVLDLAALCDESMRWQSLTSHVLSPSLPFAVHELLFHQNYAQRRQQQLPCPAWIPGAEEVAATHLAEWISALGLVSYEELHDWSVTNPQEFANKLAAALTLRFRQPPICGCDLSEGVENARWYSQATLNIVESCFQADDGALAVIFGNEQGPLEYITYAQLEAMTARVANGLAEYGVLPGDRVAICMPMTVDAVATFLGIIAAGCSVVTIAD
ncbi:MAG: AMP-binding protein, partial [Aureliella sp.]